jgi:hypothetical protein
LYDNGYTVKGVQKIFKDKSNKSENSNAILNYNIAIKDNLKIILADIDNLIKK